MRNALGGRRRGTSLLVWVLCAAIVGIGIFSVMVWRAVDVETVASDQAQRRFAAVRAGLPTNPPLLVLDETGKVLRRDEPRVPSPSPVTRLRVLSYQAQSSRLTSADVAFWFFRLKAPAARLALRDTGLDLDELGITPAELARFGPVLVIDSRRGDGDLLLVWTQ